MTIEWEKINDSEWKEEFKQMKVNLSISDIKLLEKGPETMKGAWRLGSLHAEYKRLKREQPPTLPNIKG
tara:strand:+ start:35 stop:241 length:207 start_codon:yes stop_codon:yes gene_type:complete